MRRFLMTRWPNYNIWSDTGKLIKFTNGVFETDDDDLCRFLYGPAMKEMVPRFIREVSADEPIPGKVPATVVSPTGLAVGGYAVDLLFCNECERGFKTRQDYDRHMKMARNHGGYPKQVPPLEEVSDGKVRSGQDA